MTLTLRQQLEHFATDRGYSWQALSDAIYDVTGVRLSPPTLWRVVHNKAALQTRTRLAIEEFLAEQAKDRPRRHRRPPVRRARASAEGGVA